MAKIIFNEQGMVGIGKTDVDVSYFTNDTSLVTIQEISDAEFDICRAPADRKSVV